MIGAGKRRRRRRERWALLRRFLVVLVMAMMMMMIVMLLLLLLLLMMMMMMAMMTMRLDAGRRGKRAIGDGQSLDAADRMRQARATTRQHEALGSSLQHAVPIAGVDGPLQRSDDATAGVLAGGLVVRPIERRVGRPIGRAVRPGGWTAVERRTIGRALRRQRSRANDLGAFRAADRRYPYTVTALRPVGEAEHAGLPDATQRLHPRLLGTSVFVQPLSAPNVDIAVVVVVVTTPSLLSSSSGREWTACI